MKALVIAGKNKGRIVHISQWANDWFSLIDSVEIFKPTQLAFSLEDMQTIMDCKNDGQLKNWYQVIPYKDNDEYIFTFREDKVAKQKMVEKYVSNFRDYKVVIQPDLKDNEWYLINPQSYSS